MRFKCPLCPKHFKSWGEAIKHLKSEHEMELFLLKEAMSADER